MESGARVVLFEWRPDDPGGVKTERSEDGREWTFRFVTPEKTSLDDLQFAVYLQGAIAERDYRLFLNGAPAIRRPLRRTDGLLFRLPSREIQPGENRLTVLAQDGAPVEIEAVIAFSLDGSYEEIHFHRAFGQKDRALAVQPPKHADQDKYDALHYTLRHTIPSMTSTNLAGELTMRARVTAGPLSQAVLDFDVNGGQMVVSRVDGGEGTSPLPYSLDTTNDRILITLPSPLATDAEFTVRVAYSGRPATGKIFIDAYTATTHQSTSDPIVFTFSEPYGARQWWPCKDVPDDKAPIDLYITAPNGYFPVANGQLLSQTPKTGNVTEFHWQESYPIATYLVSLCCTNYAYAGGQYTALDGQTAMPVGHYVYAENLAYEQGAVEGTLEAMRYFSETFGEYPFLTEKYVTATHEDTAGMEHQTCTSMPPNDVGPDGRGRRNIHELAHAWFGDMVTMDHFDHLWLNEGWATYCEALYYGWKNGPAAYHSTVAGWITSGISNTTALVNPNADNFSGSVVYRRGAMVLHMLRHVVGDENFFEAARDYLQDHAYATALTPDLQAACEARYGASLDWFFQEWVYRAGRPTYAFSWNVATGPGGPFLQLTVNQTQTAAAYTMPIDIRVRDLQGRTRDYVIWNDSKSQTFQLPLGDFQPLEVQFDPDYWIYKAMASSTTAPLPTLESVRSVSGGQAAEIRWRSGGAATTGYMLIRSVDLNNWTIVAGAETLTAATTSYQDTTTSPGVAAYYRVRAFASGASPSALSDIYGACGGREGAGRVLIVDGYDRWDTQGRGTSHPWAAWHGAAAAPHGVAFDTCANEAAENATVALGDYAAVLWALGEESTDTESFSDTEQARVAAYLNAGGQLFVSGSEIAWDLGNRGSTTDQAFLQQYLKANFANDDSSVYSVIGVSDTLFDGWWFAYDDGSRGIYYCDWPDVLTPAAGGAATLVYFGTQQVAGIQYEGPFTTGGPTGRLVYFGFPFETIYDGEVRKDVMGEILDFFQVRPPEVHNGSAYIVY